MFRRPPYQEANPFRTPEGSRRMPTNMRNRRQKAQDFTGPVYVKEAFEVIINDSSSPPHYPYPHDFEEIPDSTIRRALEDFTQSVEKMQEHYSFVKHLTEQQAGFVESQRETLKKCQTDLDDLERTIQDVHQSLVEVDKELDILRDVSNEPRRTSLAKAFFERKRRTKHNTSHNKAARALQYFKKLNH